MRGRVKLLPNGPPVPYPVQFRVRRTGRRARCARCADEVKDVMRANPEHCAASTTTGTRSVKVLRLEIDQDKARALGVTSQSLAQASRTILSGTTIGQYREGDKLIDIVLRQPLDERNAITDLAKAYLPTASGRSMPLSQIAQGRASPGSPACMWRENRDFADHGAGRRRSRACRAPP